MYSYLLEILLNTSSYWPKLNFERIKIVKCVSLALFLLLLLQKTMHSCQSPGFSYSNMWILCKRLLWNTSLCLLLWYSLLLYIFWSFWWKESHLDEVLPHNLKVLVPWPFPGSNHQADLLATAAADEMCHLPSHWDFAIHCLILIPSDLTRQDVSWISSWTTYCLGFYSAPFVHNLNVHPPVLQGPSTFHSVSFRIFRRKLPLDLPNNWNITEPLLLC